LVLRDIVAWADDPENHDHPVVTIHFDVKNAPGDEAGFTHAFDRMLEGTVGAKRIYAPGEIIGDEADLVRAVRAGRWARLEALRGRFVLCLSGRVGRKLSYARREPRARLCFADYAGSKGAPRKGHRVFANLFVDAARYRENLERVTRTTGFIARGYNIVSRSTWDASVDGGANILSGDVLDSRDLSLGGTGLAPARHRR